MNNRIIRIIIILSLSLVILFPLFSNEPENEVKKNKYFDDLSTSFSKGYDFSVGGGLIFSNLNIQVSKEFYKTKLFPEKIFNAGIGLSLPFSYTNFINPSHSLGFILETGYLVFFSEFFIFFHNIPFTMSLRYKVGNPEKRTRFVLETGCLVNYELVYFQGLLEEDKKGNNVYVFLNTALSYLYIGPKLYLGTEFRYKKFSFEFGGYLSVLFDGVNDRLASYHYFTDYYQQFRRYQSLVLGLEFRYNFYFFKVIK